MPIMSFLRLKQNLACGEFIAWCSADIERQVQQYDKAGARCVISEGRPQPAGFVVPAGLRTEVGPAPWPPYDAALLEESFELAEQTKQSMAGWLDLVHSYQVSEAVIKDDGSIATGRPSTGIKYLRGLSFHPDLPPSAVKRSWANHAKLAVDVHVGASRYVQWWVEKQITPDAPNIGGIAELHFANDAALEERFVDSPRGAKEIVQDLAHFVAGGPPRLFARDYVFQST